MEKRGKEGRKRMKKVNVLISKRLSIMKYKKDWTAWDNNVLNLQYTHSGKVLELLVLARSLVQCSLVRKQIRIDFRRLS